MACVFLALTESFLWLHCSRPQLSSTNDTKLIFDVLRGFFIQWTVLAGMWFMLILTDFMFLGDNTFIYDPNFRYPPHHLKPALRFVVQLGRGAWISSASDPVAADRGRPWQIQASSVNSICKCFFFSPAQVENDITSRVQIDTTLRATLRRQSKMTMPALLQKNRKGIGKAGWWTRSTRH